MCIRDRVFIVSVKAGILVSVGTVIYIFIAVQLFRYHKPLIINDMIAFANQYDVVEKRMLEELALPYAIMDMEGRMIWSNRIFSEITGRDQFYKKNISTVFQDITPDKLPVADEPEISEMSIHFGDRIYRVSMQRVTMGEVVSHADILENMSQNVSLIAMYLYDETELKEYIQKNEDNKLVVAPVSYTHLDVYKRQDYGLERLLSGEMPEEEQQKKVKMAKEASFEERFLVTGLLLDGLNGSFLTYEKMDGETGAVYQELLHLKAFLQDKKDMTALDEFTDMKKKSLAVRLEAELLTADQQTTEELVIRTLEEFSLTIRKEHITETEAGFERIRQLFTEMAEKRKACAKKISGELEQAFTFMKECFGDGQETVLFVTGLTRNSHAAAFIREYGCDPYFACSEKLLYRKQEKKLQEECASLLEI